jgi:hypothetical protein
MSDWRRVACPVLAASNLVLAGWLIVAKRQAHTASTVEVQPAASAAHVAAGAKQTGTAAPAPLTWQEALTLLRRARVPSAIIATVVREKIARDWTPREAAFERQYLEGQIDA